MIFAVLDLWVWHISPLHGLYKLAKFFTLIFAVLLPNVTRHYAVNLYNAGKSNTYCCSSEFIHIINEALGPEDSIFSLELRRELCGRDLSCQFSLWWSKKQRSGAGGIMSHHPLIMALCDAIQYFYLANYSLFHHRSAREVYVLSIRDLTDLLGS